MDFVRHLKSDKMIGIGQGIARHPARDAEVIWFV